MNTVVTHKTRDEAPELVIARGYSRQLRIRLGKSLIATKPTRSETSVEFTFSYRGYWHVHVVIEVEIEEDTTTVYVCFNGYDRYYLDSDDKFDMDVTRTVFLDRFTLGTCKRKSIRAQVESKLGNRHTSCFDASIIFIRDGTKQEVKTLADELLRMVKVIAGILERQKRP